MYKCGFRISLASCHMDQENVEMKKDLFLLADWEIDVVAEADWGSEN